MTEVTIAPTFDRARQMFQTSLSVYRSTRKDLSEIVDYARRAAQLHKSLLLLATRHHNVAEQEIAEKLQQDETLVEITRLLTIYKALAPMLRRYGIMAEENAHVSLTLRSARTGFNLIKATLDPITRDLVPPFMKDYIIAFLEESLDYLAGEMCSRHTEKVMDQISALMAEITAWTLKYFGKVLKIG